MIDLKTAERAPEETVRGEYRRQLLWYSYLAFETTGEWPKQAKILFVDGSELTMQVNSTEAMELGSVARAALDNFNAQVEARVPVSELARASAETCRFCSYRGVCEPFFEAWREDWSPYRLVALGTVATVQNVAGGRCAITMDVLKPTELAGLRLAILDIPDRCLPEPDTPFSVVDAVALRSGNYRMAWDSELIHPVQTTG